MCPVCICPGFIQNGRERFASCGGNVVYVLDLLTDENAQTYEDNQYGNSYDESEEFGPRHQPSHNLLGRLEFQNFLFCGFRLGATVQPSLQIGESAVQIL